MAELMVLAGVHQRICPHRPTATVKELYGSGRWSDPGNRRDYVVSRVR